MTRSLAGILGLTTLLGALACTACSSNTHVVQPPGRPPTPATVTLENPGGDAADPELAALQRLSAQNWGWKYDRFETLRVPLLDWTHWARVKIFGQPTRAAYRFGDDHLGVIAIWYTPIDGPNDPDRCLEKYLQQATPVAEAYGVRVGESRVLHVDQKLDGERRPMVIKVMDGAIESLVESNDYVGAVAAYQSWPGTCLLQGFAFIATHHRDLAVKIRDRWVAEGAVRLGWDKKVIEAPPTDAR